MTEPKISMPIVDLDGLAEELGRSGQRVRVLWQEGESLAFVARGREYRSEFHLNPSDEVMHMIRGEMNLHYRNPDGTEDIAVIPQGASIYTRSGIPHSPRFPPDAFVLVMERLRRPGELDRFQWFCRRRACMSMTTAPTQSARPTSASSTTSTPAPARSAGTCCPHHDGGRDGYGDPRGR